MEQKSMTALICAFARAYHWQNNEVKIFSDSVARQLLTDEEYHQISKSMSDGIGFFNPSFTGNQTEALRWVVEHQLAPATLGRAAFAEESLERATAIGTAQYLILGAGYDTFAYRQPLWANKLQIFEIDHPDTASDKQQRLKNAGFQIEKNVHYVNADFTENEWQKALTAHDAFDRSKISFCSILGVVQYLSKQSFSNLLCVISDILPEGSFIIFDYPDENSYTEKAGERAKKQSMLIANAADEKMLASYSYLEMEQLLSDSGFLIYTSARPSYKRKSAANAAVSAHLAAFAPRLRLTVSRARCRGQARCACSDERLSPFVARSHTPARLSYSTKVPAFRRVCRSPAAIGFTLSCDDFACPLRGFSRCACSDERLSPFVARSHEHLTPAEMTMRYFSEYNKQYPAHAMAALDQVNYCLAVKK